MQAIDDASRAPREAIGRTLVRRAGLRVGLVLTSERLARSRVGEAVERVLDHPVEVTHWPSYGALTDALVVGELEVAWLPPAAYAHARREPGVRLLASVARQGASDYRSVLLGRTGVVTSISDARGRRAAWVDPWSAAGYLAPRALLRAGGVDPDRALGTQRFFGSYDAAMDAVASGAAEIAGGFCSLDESGRITKRGWSSAAPVRVLATSRPIPSDTLCAGRSLSAGDAAAIAAALAFPEAGALAAILGGTAFAAADPSRYDALERMLAAIAHA